MQTTTRKVRSSLGAGPHTFPAQVVTQTVKETAEYKEGCMDYFDYMSSVQSKEKWDIWRNYRQVSGDVDVRDYQYYTDPLSMGADKKEKYGTTFDIVHFPIMNAPIQSMIGERIKRPINYTITNETAKSRNEKLRVKTDMIREYAINQINQRLQQQVQAQGVDPASQQGQQMIQSITPEAIQDYTDRDYVDIAQTAGDRIVRQVWKDNVMDDELIDGFRHATISAREFYHVYVCAGKIKVKNLSPLDVFYHRSPSVKWISEGQYAGFRWYLTPSSILDLFYDDLKMKDLEDIEAVINPNAKSEKAASSSGIGSIHYNTGTFSDNFGNLYDSAVNQDELQMMIQDFQSYGDRANAFNTYGLVKVVKAYWKSVRKIGFLHYFDENDQEQITMVDDNYEPNKDMGEWVEWRGINQVMEGGKIGDDIYLPVRPYKDAIFDISDLDYCPLPIEGCTYNDTHTKPVSQVDLMRPWNELYNIIAYELRKDMNSSLGKVMFMSVDHIPNIPGFTWEKWYYWAKELKIAWVKQPPRGNNTFNQFSAADMSFADQIVAKMEALTRIKQECEALAGFSPARIGQPTANTLGQSNQEIVASINQTEYLFFKHFKLVERLLNFILRISKHVVLEHDTYDHLFDDMELAYMKGVVDSYGTDRLTCSISNTLEDLLGKQKLDSILNLAVSNGADIEDAGDLLLSKSVAETRTIFHSLRRKRKEAEAAQQQHEQQLADKMDKQAQEDRAWDREKTYATLESQENQTYMKTFGLQKDNMKDTDGSGTADVLEYDKFNAEIGFKDRELRMKERQQFMSEVVSGKTLQQKDKELALKEKDIDTKLKIAKSNKNKYDK